MNNFDVVKNLLNMTMMMLVRLDLYIIDRKQALIGTHQRKTLIRLMDYIIYFCNIFRSALTPISSDSPKA